MTIKQKISEVKQIVDCHDGLLEYEEEIAILAKRCIEFQEEITKLQTLKSCSLENQKLRAKLNKSSKAYNQLRQKN